MTDLPGVKPIPHRDGVGRPTDYRPEYDAQARKLCELGATDADLAEAFGVSERAINRWRVSNESFAIASRVGKEHADERVKISFYKLATGYEYDEEYIDKRGEKRTRRVVVPPNPMAAAKWLAVRGNREFAEKTQIEHSGGVKVDAFDPRGLTDEELVLYQRLMEIRARKGDETSGTATSS